MDVKRWWFQYRNRRTQSLVSLNFSVLHHIINKNVCWVWVFILFQWIQLTLFHILSSLFPYFYHHQIQRIIHTHKIGLYLNFCDQKYANTIHHACVRARIYQILLFLLKENVWPMPWELSKFNIFVVCFDIFTLYKGLET